jgi:hypothetical protein
MTIGGAVGGGIGITVPGGGLGGNGTKILIGGTDELLPSSLGSIGGTPRLLGSSGLSITGTSGMKLSRFPQAARMR